MLNWRSTIFAAVFAFAPATSTFQAKPMTYPYAGNPDNYPTSVDLPQGGNLKEVGSVDVSLEGTLDRTAFLASRMNDFFRYTDDTDSGGDPAFIESYEYDIIGTVRTKSPSILVGIPSCKTNDVLLVRLHVGGTELGGYAADAHVIFNLYAIDDFGGAAVYSQVAGARSEHKIAGANGQGWPISLAGRHVVAADGTCRVGLEVRLATIDAGSEIDLYSGVYLEVQRIKAAP